jgi:hypothetical protein
MAISRIEVTEEAKTDLSHYAAFERKLIVSGIREQLTDQPLIETKNRSATIELPRGNCASGNIGSFMKWTTLSK